MSYFRHIRVKDFRGLEDVEIKSLGRVNFFAGPNNVGKTTLLEGLFILIGMSNPAISWRVNALRTSDNSTFGDLRFLFRNINRNIQPELFACFDDGEQRRIRISSASSYSETDIKNVKSTDNAVIWNQLVASIERVNSPERPDYKGKTVLTANSEGKVDANGAEDFVEILNALFITSADKTVAASFSEAVKLRKKDYIIEQARAFDPRINTIELLSDGLYIGIDGLDQMLPLSMNGIGLSKFLSIVCAAACGSYRVLLIDEIEDGLHYSAYSTLLKALYTFAENNDIQLFITTHSIDALKHLAAMVRDSSEYEGMTSVYSLLRTDKGIKAYRYGGEDLVEAVNKQIELRG